MCVFIFERTPWRERLAREHVKAVDKSCKKIGVNIKDNHGDYRSLIDVLEDISDQWDKVN